VRVRVGCACAVSLLAAAPAVAGCSSLLGIDDLSLADAPAGPADASADASASCIGGGLVQVCPEPAPSSDFIVVGPRQIDTDSDPACLQVTSGTVEVCALVHASIEIAAAATLRAVGKRPLVLAAARSISVLGTIDVSSVLGKPAGAGADPQRCTSPIVPGGGAGGAGGSFGGTGGTGGASGAGNAGAPAPPPVATVTEIRGGCAGGRGGASSLQQIPGTGGGAVYLAAKEQIVVDGRINASGAGGAGGTTAMLSGTGGAGGGAGGLIGLDAPAITGGGTLFANGGGAGGGAGPFNQATAGGESPDAKSAGLGGTGSARGGDGSVGMSPAGARGSDGGGTGGGGGGGGGGAGVIYVRGTLSVSGAISPPPRQP
jgi:hypothetical protein